jgi:hypothetical protein
MRVLAFSDVLRDLSQARRLAKRPPDMNVVVAAGDFASAHRGLEERIDALTVIDTRVFERVS